MSNQEGDATERTDSLPRDDVYALLASERRRYVLSVLREHESLSLPDLADEVALREHDAPLPQVPEDAVLQVYLSLWHVHVPKLTDADVVAYDQDRDIVTLAEHAQAVEQFALADADQST
ncbi:hypothetical protein [Halobacterium sp. R2-5]|uniref:DUF7344 domain-containing protein n=1 Tax=Halobacterium sp. R2-5 TaxID=2715751 RepID=UPI00141D83F5|nr:hypothetical protein [Halobacterium sp. R2-5]NIB98363.1 hypothetical protein [Halobacterium sp. R2-5]